MLVGIRKEFIIDRRSSYMGTGAVVSSFKIDNRKVNILSIYNQGNLEDGIEMVNNFEDDAEEIVIVGGHFNVRTGNLGSFMDENAEIGIRKRKSKDEVLGKEGRHFIETIQDK